MSPIDLHIDTSELDALIRAARGKSPDAIRSAFHELGAHMQQVSADRARKRRFHDPTDPDLWPTVDADQLARSIRAVVRGPKRRPALFVGSPLPDAKIAQEGGKVRTLEAQGKRPTAEQARRRVFGFAPIYMVTRPMRSVPRHARAKEYQGLIKWKDPSTRLWYLAQPRTTASNIKSRRTYKGFADRHRRRLQRGSKPYLKSRGMMLLRFRLVESYQVRKWFYLYFAHSDMLLGQQILKNQLSAALEIQGRAPNPFFRRQ